MKIKVYEYNGCSTCKKALRFLDSAEIAYEKLPIVDSPPSKEELRTMVKYLKASGMDFKKLFNTSGVLYREMNIAEKLKNGMNEDEAIALLAANGKLIKRPFLLTGKNGAVGFKEADWKALLSR